MPVFPFETYALLALVAFFAGFVDGVAGGGGLLALPALFMTGMPAQLCLGTNKVASTMGVIGSSYAYLRKGLLKPALWKYTIVATLIGSISGVCMVHLISSAFFKKLLPFVILAVVIYMLIPKKIVTEFPENFKPNKKSGIPLGLGMGFYDGFMGPGTGSFWVTLVMAIYKLDIVTASGIARFMNLISSSVALITFTIFGNVDYYLGLTMGTTYLIGSYIGAHSAIRFGAKFIRPIFLMVVIAIAVKLVMTS